MDWKLELVVLPVADLDRSKAFYMDNAGFGLDVDHREGDFRVVQLTPPGSACSVTLMANPEAAGSMQGLHLVVTDIEAARAELVGRGAARARSSTISRVARSQASPRAQRLQLFFLLQRPRRQQLARSRGETRPTYGLSRRGPTRSRSAFGGQGFSPEAKRSPMLSRTGMMPTRLSTT